MGNTDSGADRPDFLFYRGRHLRCIPGYPANGGQALGAGADWRGFDCTPEQVGRYFEGRMPLLVRGRDGWLGEGDFWVCDMDVDSEEADRALAAYLPPTPWTFGRQGKPWRHRLYLSPSAATKVSVEDPGGGKILELLTDTYTWAPGGRHPKHGTPIVFASGLPEGPPDVRDDLEGVTHRAGCAALLGRYWARPGMDGKRHDAGLALVGALLRLGWSDGEVETFLTAVLAAAGEDPGARIAELSIEAARAKLAAREPVTGWTTLKKIMGEAVVGEVQRRLASTVTSVPLSHQGRSGLADAPRPFPLRRLPPVVREFVTELAEELGQDPGLVVGHALATTGAAVGLARAVGVKRGWTEPCVFWCLVVATSGSMKTAPWEGATRRLKELDLARLVEHKNHVNDYREALEYWQEQPKGDRGPKPQPPPPPARLVVSDTTIEALAVTLEQSPKGVLCTRDELSAWFAGFSRYSAATDRPHWLEMHSGGGLNISRKSPEKPSIIVPRAAVSVTGTIQPHVLRAHMSQESLESGLAARFLFAAPPLTPQYWVDDEMNPETAARYDQLVHDLVDLEPADPGQRKPYVLTIDPAVRGSHFIPFVNDIADVAFEAEHGAERSAFSKIKGYAARLALWHHVVSCVAAGVDDTKVPIGLESVGAGIEIAWWFVHEGRRLYTLLRQEQEVQDLQRHLDHVRAVLRKSGADSLTARDLMRARRTAYPKAEDAARALDSLVAAGKLTRHRTPAPGGGHPAVRYRPVPENRRAGQWDSCDSCPPADGEDEQGGCDSCRGSCPDPGQDPIRKDLQEKDLGNPIRQGGDQVSQLSYCHTPETAAPEWVTGVPPQGGNCHTPDPFRLVDTDAKAADLCRRLGGQARVAVDVETTGLNPRKDRVRLLQVASPDGVWVVDCCRADVGPVAAALSRVPLVVAHNALFDGQFLAELGYSGDMACTMIASRVLRAGEREKPSGAYVGHSLGAVLERELGVRVDKSLQKSDWSRMDLTAEQLRYAAADVAHLLPLHDDLARKLDGAGLAETYAVEMGAFPTVLRMSLAGVGFDADRWGEAVAAKDRERLELLEELDRTVPVRPEQGSAIDAGWNWRSNAQLLQILRAIEPSVPRTGDEVLAALDHPFAAALRRYRAADKIVSAYGEKFRRRVAGGRVHPDWNQLGSVAGRMSCSNPNFQQIPRSKDFRRCFVAPAGRVLIIADYSQIELRLAARIAGDEAMIEAYAKREDLHARTARLVLGAAQASKDQRQAAKAINFGLIYGMGAETLRGHARQNYGVEMTLGQAREYRRKFFREYKGLRAWHRRTGAQEGPVETRTLIGRRRVGVEKFTEKLNTPVQGSGADGLKRALGLLWERRGQHPTAVVVACVHDEIVLEADAGDAEQAREWLVRAMVDGIAPLTAPVPVEVAAVVSPCWTK